MNEIGMQAREHLAEEQVSAWLAGEVSDGERERIAAHLADCDRCREELVAVRRLLHGETAEHSQPRRRRTIPFLAGAAAVAAALLLVLVPGARDEAPRTRSAPEADAAVMPLVVVEPGTDGIQPEGPIFTWRTAGPDAQYTLTLTDDAGSLLWRSSTADTALRLPDDVPLAPGRTYFWTVDALLSDGETATSGLQGFETAP
ncbi:MAG: zf-HC2 domain-containing protein [marine benthic group bacterium]|jgi:hypothetical protein|nr:zf-HC2 domain-containing protein [Gemmatimonadota bacterium]